MTTEDLSSEKVDISPPEALHSQAEDVAMPAAPRQRLWRRHPHLLALGLCVLIMVLSIAAARWVRSYKVSGYAAAFVLPLVASASFFFSPVPGVVVAYVLGGMLNPFFIGILTGAGMALGEVTGYLAGYSGSAFVRKRRFFPRIKGWIERYGDIFIFLLALIPNPIFDLAGAVAGVLEYSLLRFLLFCWAGKTLRALTIAYAGHWSLEYFIVLFRQWRWLRWPF